MKRLRSQKRKLAFPFTLLAGLLLIGTVMLKGTQPVESDEGQGNLPAAVDLNPDSNIFETAFVAMEAQVDLGNEVVAKAQTFNGIVPGSRIRTQGRRPGHRALHE